MIVSATDTLYFFIYCVGKLTTEQLFNVYMYLHYDEILSRTASMSSRVRGQTVAATSLSPR